MCISAASISPAHSIPRADDTGSCSEDVAAAFQILEEEDEEENLDLDAENVEDYTFVVKFAMVTENIPMSLHQAINGPDAKHWILAAQAKFTQLERLKTWDIVEAPMGADIIRNHCVLMIKCDTFNEINKYKVRLGLDSLPTAGLGYI
ncbi:hypothetical protein DFH07DRAFT_985697 [Mycena maculata]|uniref:Uncharacterized protein n=1 Tax=Mycena maculata TaxID=230809 RepID=A0AAD7MZ44_9AGAR|nr:hypothetical protein DFH07DRAFT_985697 [Mycena maculata]